MARTQWFLIRLTVFFVRPDRFFVRPDRFFVRPHKTVLTLETIRVKMNSWPLDTAPNSLVFGFYRRRRHVFGVDMSQASTYCGQKVTVIVSLLLIAFLSLLLLLFVVAVVSCLFVVVVSAVSSPVVVQSDH